MALPGVDSKQYPVEVLTENYFIQCSVEPIGMLMTYLDSPERSNFLLKDITMTGLDKNSAVNSIKIDELWLKRREIIAIRIDEGHLEGEVQKLPAEERLRIFMPRFVVQGTLTRGEDTRQGDMFEVMKGTWAAVSNAQVFPLAEMKTQTFRDANFLLINKDCIQSYGAA